MFFPERELTGGNKNSPLLRGKFVVPPFSILDTMQDYWLRRRRAWISLGIKSEIGRKDDLLGAGLKALCQNHNYTRGGQKVLTGTSIFDPTLCEIIYRWFCPPQATVLDPFAGGSVRGIVAAYLGHRYTGFDLSQEQIDSNNEQAEKIVPNNKPEWICADSSTMDAVLRDDEMFDCVVSCPPYHNLEVYSDRPEDLSNMNYQDFLHAYGNIISKAVRRLRDNRFAVFVVSEIRGKDGFYKSFVPETIQAFEKAGAGYYNEMILVNSAGTLPVRCNNMFKNRKIGRMHQNVLVFLKGDPQQIQSIFSGDV